jgi:hypothetical protein
MKRLAPPNEEEERNRRVNWPAPYSCQADTGPPAALPKGSNSGDNPVFGGGTQGLESSAALPKGSNSERSSGSTFVEPEVPPVTLAQLSVLADNQINERQSSFTSLPKGISRSGTKSKIVESVERVINFLPFTSSPHLFHHQNKWNKICSLFFQVFQKPEEGDEETFSFNEICSRMRERDREGIIKRTTNQLILIINSTSSGESWTGLLRESPRKTSVQLDTSSDS